jgi:hypothetical protein
MKKMIEAGIVWLLVLGPLFIGVGFSFWGFGNKIAGIWWGTAGLGVLLIAAALQLQLSIMPEEKSPVVTPLASKPLLTVFPAEIKDFSPGHRTGVSISVRNNGNAAAYDLTMDVSVAVRPYPFQKDQDFPPVAASHNSTATINPGDDVWGFGQFDEPLSLSQIQSIIDGKDVRMVVAGTVSYRLASGTKCRRRFMFIAGGSELVEAIRTFKEKGTVSAKYWKMADGFNDLNSECE